MAIKTMLVPIDGSDAATPSLETAGLVGRGLEAHVSVFHVSADPKDAVPLLGEGMSGAMIEEMIDLAEKDAKGRAAAARRMFDDFCARHAIAVVDKAAASQTVSASWITETGREDEAVARRGRLADLVVVGRPTPDSDLTSTLTLNAAIFETGRPVLVVPPEAPAALGRRIAVFWNGTAESARAAAAALPFFDRAESTVILTAESDRTSTSAATDLAGYLAWHGVDAPTEAVSPGGGSVGAALLEAAGKGGADLLVMGAYTHSRMRQLILGGVTKHVLAAATIPLLMIH